MLKQRVLRIVLCVAAPLSVFAAGEWWLRRIDWSYTPHALTHALWSVERDRAIATGEDLYVFHPHQLWAPRPGAKLPWANGERFNADGYRGPQLNLQQAPKSLRIVALGGAATLGVGVRYEDTFVALTSRLVSQRIMACETMNLGVEHFSVRQSLERYRDLARPYRPQLVVLSIAPAMAYMPAPGGITDHEKIKSTRPLDVEASPKFPYAGCGLRGFQGFEWVRDVLDGGYWADRDFEFHLKRLEPAHGGLDWPGTRRVPIDDYNEALALLVQETFQDGAHLILISIPTPSSVAIPPIQEAYERMISEFAGRLSLVFLDRHMMNLAALGEDVNSEDLFGSDRYLSECGHSQIAETLTEIIVQGIQKRSTEAPYKKPERAPK